MRKILLTGARSYITLDLARKIHAGGHEVYVADSDSLHLCRFSQSVKKSFTTPSPRLRPKEFIQKLKEIILAYKIDVLIPTCEEILYISQGKEELPCEVFCEKFSTIHDLHSKWHFTLLQQKLGIATPETFLVKNQAELGQINRKQSYALKATYSRASQNMVKLTPDHPLPTIQHTPYNPLIAQKWLDGNKYCTYSIAHEGKLYAHATYPVDYTVDGNSCITFRSIDHEGVLAWVENFIQKIGFTGQIAFDIIETEDGGIYSIECNPRSTSGVHLFHQQDHLDQAFFKENTACIQPTKGKTRQLAVGMLLYGWKGWNKGKNLPTFWKQLLTSRDILWERTDKKPFIFIPLLFPFYVLKSLRLNVSLPAAFTYDFDWNGNASDREVTWEELETTL